MLQMPGHRKYLPVLFKLIEVCLVYIPSRSFHPGTPQGGVLSPNLKNILMHRLLTSLPDIIGTIITCHDDDLFVHSTSPRDLPQFLSSFSVILLFPQMRAEYSPVALLKCYQTSFLVGLSIPRHPFNRFQLACPCNKKHINKKCKMND